MNSNELNGPDRELDRIVFFSDAVFAIAITLLVLEIRVPEVPEKDVSELLTRSLISLWPKYLGYVISFLSIAVIWNVHHRIFREIRRYDGSHRSRDHAFFLRARPDDTAHLLAVGRRLLFRA